MAQIGYYPGQPIPRVPRAGKTLPPQQYDFDVISKWVEQTFRDIDFSRLPGGVKDDIIRDVQRQLFSVSAQPKEADYDVQRALEYGDINETPGVQLQVNLNPQDWLKDPGKEFDKSVVKGIKDSIFNWDDIRNYVEKKYFWEPVIAGRTDLAPEGTGTSTGLADDIAKKLMGIDPTNTVQPYQMKDIGVFKEMKKADGSLMSNEVTLGGSADFSITDLADPNTPYGSKKRDVYGDLGQSFLKFIDKSESAGSRNGAIHGLRSKTLEAVVSELNQPLRNPMTVDTSAITNLTAAYNAMVAMQEVRAGPTGKAGLAMASKSLGSIALEGVDKRTEIEVDKIDPRTGLPELDTAGLAVKIKKKVGKQTGAVNFKGQAISMTGTLEGLWNPAEMTGIPTARKSSIGKALYTLDKARDSLLSDAEKARFDSSVAVFKNKITEIQKLVESNLLPGAGINDSARAKVLARRLKGQIDSLQKDFLDSNPLGKGFEFKYGEALQRSLIDGKDPLGYNDLRAVFREVKRIRESAGDRSGIENAVRLLNAANPIFDRMDFEDFAQNVQDGKVMQKYMWPRVRTYVEAMTPAVWVREHVMAPTHSFGLVYDPAGSLINARGAGHYYDELHDYKYSAKTDNWWGKNLPKNTFNLKIDGIGDVKFQGGNHLIGALNYQKVFTVNGTPTLGPAAAAAVFRLNAMVDAKGKITGFTDNGAAFLNFLNKGNDSTVKALLGGPDDAAAVKKWLRQSNRFKAFLYIRKNELGLKFDARRNLIETGADGAANAAITASFIQKLSERAGSSDYINVLLERAGRLQILASYANQVQTQILKRIGKFVAPFLKIKNAISSKVSDVVANFFAGLVTSGAGAATGGLALFLNKVIAKIVKPIVKFLTNFVINRVEKLSSAILHGDLSGFMYDQEKLIAAVVKSCLIFLGLPLIFFFFIIFMIVGGTLTTMPVVDPTRSDGFTVQGVVRPRGTGNYAGCSADSFTNTTSSGGTVVNCFHFLDTAQDSHGSPLMAWPAENIAAFTEAINTIGAKGGNYLRRLCDDGDINLLRADDNPGYCGEVFGRDIVFHSTCTYTKQQYLNYLFAHETAHVYQTYHSADYSAFGSQAHSGEGSLPTYPVYDTACSSSTPVGEDFAETIGSWLQINTCDCSGISDGYGASWEAFWNRFPQHKAWLDEFFNRSYP